MSNVDNNQVPNKHSSEGFPNWRDFARIWSVVKGRPRDLLLFELAVQTKITMKELLTLKVKHLLDLKVGDKLTISKGTQNDSAIIISQTIYETFLKYMKEVRLLPEDYLFKSRRGQKPLNLSSVSNMIKNWSKAANIDRPCGIRSLRKSWNYYEENKSPPKLDFPREVYPMKFLQPIEMFSVQEITYQRLFEAIISGKIPPGARLTTAEISERFKVSPTPVRFALNWLEARGFVISQKKKACIVRELSLVNLKEIMSIRLALETFGVGLSCKACTKETLSRLESLLRIFETTDDLDEFQRTNNQFHQTLCADAKMPLLEQLISDLCNRLSPYFIIYIFKLEDIKSYREVNINSHRKMYEGMRRKDPEEVCNWLKFDLTEGMTKLEETLRRMKVFDSALEVEVSKQ